MLYPLTFIDNIIEILSAHSHYSLLSRDNQEKYYYTFEHDWY
jgi:hypothetical protein